MNGRELSVVVPTLDEAETLPRLLKDLAALGPGVEIVVCDGGSRDGTRARAEAGGARVVTGPRGRGSQLRAGAEAAGGSWLFFLHADTHLPPAAAAALQDFLASAGPHDAAAFRFRLAVDGWRARLQEAGQRLRQRLTGLVYGDQGLVLSRHLYEAVGGYPDWPLMEDVELVDRIRTHGRLHVLEAALPTSPRRYREEGRGRAVLRNLALILLFRLGVSPRRLLRWYPTDSDAERDPVRNSRDGEPGWSPGAEEEDRVLLVFAKAPRPGRVKTRLAADIGDDRATRIYRRLGSSVVEAVRRGAWRTRVCYAPANAEAELRRWLGEEGLEFRPQDPGDLGHRMERAMREAFQEGADRVCIVGTDAPGVDGSVVERAFAALETPETAVVGPARDGGYYLLALRRPCPRLFHGIPWSTSEVLPRTLERITEAGLQTRLLAERTDVDRVQDLPPELARL